MKVDITQMLLFFDNLLPFTDEEQAVYWLETKRKDDLVINMMISIYEERVSFIIYGKNDVAIATVRLTNCSEVRVLDEEKKCLEVVHNFNNDRCFLSLVSNSIIEYTENSEPK